MISDQTKGDYRHVGEEQDRGERRHLIIIYQMGGGVK